MSNWYAAKILANREMLAVQNLSRQGYETFCPRIVKHVRHARSTLRKLVPLFPGYLFVNIDMATTRWRPVDSTFGVASLVKFGGQPARLPAGLVEAMQAAATPDGEIVDLSPAADAPYEIGDAVRIIGGALNDWIGRVIALPAADRVTLLIELASRQVKLTVPAGRTLPAFCQEAAA